MRLDKLLANSGFGSRKDVKKIVKAGAVMIDGVPAKDIKTHVDPNVQDITVYGEPAEYREFIYVMMNKPQGVLSATEDSRQKTVVDLLTPEEQRFEPFPAGRLDKDTEGFLLLTNDGQLAHRLLSPKKHVPKTYEVHLKSPLSPEDMINLERGVTIEGGYKTKPAAVETITQSPDDMVIHLTITEGKYHQVKLMAKSVGNEVTYLKRLSMGAVSLDPALAPGEFRELTEEELAALAGTET
ncbi:16S rRNA pseudouridine(516) synthase [Bacillus nakamurai]|uniref:Pseudouridine synthase n=1 Tax=Bacillus nakamurai TaxID=1793963 RepID=A0A150FCC7_9BACI|nr:pseudouridine synthase [Bacillus nakamurai]KXZ20273.1 16S rRNA pseudouridine(516) synthase [Bacillus nakamurai]KXZ23234.1 16S rRNA pseudouridine(516) synthase [Bacillus nakamurai]MCC9024402.1 rRNA pseudouridine synthase [Bacillus nakamurai]MED1227991.1 pseudouridine synthase [Bacillus nakamurai]